MGFADFYFEKQKNFKIKIQEKPQSDLKYIVVIPCYNEFNLIETLDSVRKAKQIKSSVEVIIVINSSENSGQKILGQNIKTYNEAKNWIEQHEDSSLRFFLLLEESLPKKFAGAGLARKIGMDQAVARFNQINNSEGFILSLDADTLVKQNYFQEIDKHLKIKQKSNALTIYFEHPIDGNDYDSELYEAITTYELYLRYYKLALHYTGFPYSFYTIGSCFGVKAEAYVKQGGMNRKQAGEDFYFLHKIFPLGNSFEINTTCVYPSSRTSDRVPFGTGPMIQAILDSKSDVFLTYKLDSFKDIKLFFERINELFNIKKIELEKFIKTLPRSVNAFLLQNDFNLAIDEMNKNSSNLMSFTKRFFNWFDAFRVLKYLNFSHEEFYKKEELISEANELYKIITNKNLNNTNYQDILTEYRLLEKQF